MNLYYIEYIVYGKEEFIKGEAKMKMDLYDIIVEADNLLTACTLAIGTREKTELRTAKYIGSVAVRQENKNENM